MRDLWREVKVKVTLYREGETKLRNDPRVSYVYLILQSSNDTALWKLIGIFAMDSTPKLPLDYKAIDLRQWKYFFINFNSSGGFKT